MLWNGRWSQDTDPPETKITRTLRAKIDALTGALNAVGALDAGPMTAECGVQVQFFSVAAAVCKYARV